MKITATLRKNGKDVETVTLKYAGEVSHFEARLPAMPQGTYTLRVLVSNPKTVNFAMYENELNIR
jgi:hypothetical protein